MRNHQKPSCFKLYPPQDDRKLIDGIMDCGDNPFWKFSLAVYSTDGVANECLALQNDLDLDVNILLFCAWLGSSLKVDLSIDDVESIVAAVKPWHESVVKPLRSVRQFTRDVSVHGAADLRAQVKINELHAECIEQEMLYAYAKQRWPEAGVGSACSSESNILTFLEFSECRGDAKDKNVRRLIEAVTNLQAI
jgi:uncharacterized protein (TIGR02444 family)